MAVYESTEKLESPFKISIAANPWPHENKRPKWWYYIDGPGGPGPHGVVMSPDQYLDTEEEAKKILKFVVIAYYAGRNDHQRDVSEMFKRLIG